MESNNSLTHVTKGIFTEEEYMLIVKVTVALRFVISMTGITTNFLCIRTFYRIGLDDSATLLFFVLAILDFLHVFTSLCVAANLIFVILEMELGIWYPVKPMQVAVLTTILSRHFVGVSYMVTTLLAVQRCICVAKPLQFKGLFTLYRTYLILAPTVVIPTLFTVAYLFQHEFQKIAIPPLNLTMFVIRYRPARDVMHYVDYVVFNLFLMPLTFVILMVCVVILTRALLKSRHFRRQTTVAIAGFSRSQVQEDIQEMQPASQKASQMLRNHMESSTSTVLPGSKEIKIITQVSLVCIIYLICNIPCLLNTFAFLIEPEYEIYQRYHYAYVGFFLVQNLFDQLNSTANFFIYYKYNRRFYQACFTSYRAYQ